MWNNDYNTAHRVMNVTLQFGVVLPHRWRYANRRTITDYARLAEDLGFDHVWVTDHVGVPPSHQERGHVFYESLITLAHVAAITNRVKLGTVVLVAGLRSPLLAAKELATLDRLSEGRVILGLGTGWIEEELRAFGVNYGQRLEHLQEYVEVLRKAWQVNSPVAHKGKFFQFDELILEPKPLQKALPVLIGGNTSASARIAGDIGDGWIPWAISAEKVSSGAKVVKAKPIYLSGPVMLDEEDEERRYKGALGEDHMILSGPDAKLVTSMDEYINAGVTSFVMSFRDVRLFKDVDNDRIIAQTKRFAKNMMPSFR